MGLELIDHRTKITAATDAVLDALAHARGVTKAEVSRGILDQYAQVCLHEANVISTHTARNPRMGAVQGKPE